jgi:D-glycero-D-manno-heptose 1,7-bisphosphate phosphatase
MKVLVHGGSLATSGGRLRAAIGALALRGHDVRWLGGGEPPAGGVQVVPHARELATLAADAVVGGPFVAGVAFTGWRARAHVLLTATHAAAMERWSLADRWAWDSLHATAIIEERDAENARTHARELPLERFALWSDAPVPATPDVAHPDAEILERALERALARHKRRSPRAAAFVDRDGTLVVERGYLSDPDQLELLPGVPAALRALRDAGIPVIVVSNQAGVGRGLFPLERVYRTMARLRVMLRSEGVELDAIYFCPHRPDEGCACRKPGTALIERAAEDQVLSLPSCMMAGDKRLDGATAQAAGGFGVLVRTGYGREEEARIGDGEFARAPDRVFDDLEAAAAWFVSGTEGHFGTS